MNRGREDVLAVIAVREVVDFQRKRPLLIYAAVRIDMKEPVFS